MSVTKKDLTDLESRLTKKMAEAIAENNKTIFATIFDYFDRNFGDIARKKDINHLPTKEEFYEREDKLMVEVKAEREENDIQQEKLEDHDKRIKKLENRIFT